jgi:hypothetical protein
MGRPTRLYWHEFSNRSLGEVLVIGAEAETSCLARQEAWTGLERRIRESGVLPTDGWSLIAQRLTPQPLV